jgi:hypothetical protein
MASGDKCSPEIQNSTTAHVAHQRCGWMFPTNFDVQSLGLNDGNSNCIQRQLDDRI